VTAETTCARLFDGIEAPYEELWRHYEDDHAMTIEIIEAVDAAAAFEIIERLTFRNSTHFLFRGHQKKDWKLQSTLDRHLMSKRDPLLDFIYNDMLSHFFTRLTAIGVDLPFNPSDARSRLEYGRHYGLPSPVIDFTYSPFVAMFFAFNGVRPMMRLMQTLPCSIA
jgi:hypothetical protein